MRIADRHFRRLKGAKYADRNLSIVIGSIIGEWIDIDRRLNRLGQLIEARFAKGGGEQTVARAFVTSSLLFCVGAMAIVGSLQSGLSGNHEMIFTKSMLDGVASVIFASSLGYGVLFSAAAVFVYQGAIVLLAQWVAPLLSDVVIAEMTCTGSLLIIALGLNMLGVTKMKVANYLPHSYPHRTLPVFIRMLCKKRISFRLRQEKIITGLSKSVV